MNDTWLRRLVYAYFLLLILEGALRKWLLPSLAGPLLIIRDPILLAVYASALYRGLWPWNTWLLIVVCLAVACALASLAAGCPLLITLFGLRTDFWQIPLIFLMPEILHTDGVHRLGRWMLAMIPAMALLALLQFRAGPDHWLNATTGGAVSDQSQQLFAAAGRVRPSGTFSFVTGMVSFLALGSAFLFDGFLRGTGRVRLWLATVGLVLALGISGSRSAILCVGLVAFAAGLACIRNPVHLRRIVVPLVAAVLAFAALHLLSDFRAGLDVNKDRFDSAGGIKQGILYRWFGDFAVAWQSEKDAAWLGAGLGLGTNVGAGLATGTRQFLLAEGEWARVILESGPILGAAFIALRLAIAIYLLRRAMRALRDRDDPLPALLFAAGVIDLTTGQWGQSTVSGFAVFTAALCLTSSEESNEDTDDAPEEITEPAKPLRGRGVFAAAIQDPRE